MKIHRKIIKIIFLALVVSLASFILKQDRIMAAPDPSVFAKQCFESAKFEDISRITCTVNDYPVDGKKYTYIFEDIDPLDSDHNYALTKNEGDLFCSNWGSAHISGDKYGIYIRDNDLTPSSIGSSDSILGQFALGINLPEFGNGRYSGGCYPFGFRDHVLNNPSDDFELSNAQLASAQNAKKWFQWNETNITSLDGVTKGNLSKTFEENPSHNPFSDWSIVVYESEVDFKNQKCEGKVAVAQANDGTPNGKVKVFTLDENGRDFSTYPELLWFDKYLNLKCGVKETNYGYNNFDNFFDMAGTAPTAVKTKAVQGDTNGNPTGGPTGGDAASGTTGEEEACWGFNWSFSWLACPVIFVSQQLAETLFGLVEDQLKFRVSPNGADSDSLGDSREQVRSVWNNFRILVSGLVVVLMLVMVIGQAIGSGPFDAYTVKKMLPRLVAGVILIQLSWPIFSWVVNSVDDLGRGIADIMYAPFGGSDNMGLEDLLKDDGGKSIGFSWFGLGAIIILGVVAPFLILGTMLTVLVAIFVGFLTLLFRKILIILALILAPVALIAWMMPSEGLRRYWKLWWDNFLKALLMYPIIIAIIAAGRIFASIGSSQADLVGFFIILIGFFGPLFILPKTFKWGGQAMQFAGSALTKAQSATLKKPREFLGERQKLWSEERKNLSQERVRTGAPFRWYRPSAYVDRFRSGQLDPSLRLPGMGNIRRRKFAQYRQGGAKFEEENIAAEYISLKDEIERIDPIDKDDYVRETAKDTSNRNRRLAALQLLADLGGNGNHIAIQREYELIYDENGRIRPGHEDASVDFQRFLTSKQSSLFAKMPHLYKTFSAGSLYSSPPETIASMTGVEVHSILARLSQRIAAGDASAQGQLNTFLTNFNGAINNDNIRGRVDQSAIEAVHGFVNGAPTPQFTNINDHHETGRVINHLERILHPSTTPRITLPASAGDILSHSRADGTLLGTAAPSTPGAGGGGASPREQWFQNAGDYQMANLANQVGGYNQLDTEDLQHIYNHSTGAVKTSAETELRNRGLIP